MQEYNIQKLHSVQNARIQRLLKMCSIFQLHELQMHLKKIDIVHPASKVFAVGDEGHNLSELKKKKLFVSLKESLQELLTGAPLELFPLKSAVGSALIIFNIYQFILGFQI